jgi:hypothetical protein
VLFFRELELVKETVSFSPSLQNKGVSEFIVDRDNNLLQVTINEQEINSSLDSDFEKTINNLRKSLDDHLTSISLIEEIIFNISKYFGSIYGSTNSYTTIRKVPNDKSIPSNESVSISSQEWQAMLSKKYLLLQKKVMELMPELWKPLEFALGVKSILYIQDCSLPFIGIILGPPSSVKTLTIELFRNFERTFYTDNFSAKSFVSHNTSVARNKLAECDLLPKMKNKLFLTPELSPTFSKRYEELTEVLGIITRIADGHGYESDTGAQGHRGYSGNYMFTWVGAAVDVPQKVHRLLGTLGPKLYFLRLFNKKNLSEENYLEKLKYGDQFKDRFDKIKNILNEYIICFDNYSITQSPKIEGDQQIEMEYTEAKTEKTGIRVIWDTSSDEEEALRITIRLARLLSRFRGVIPTWETKDTQGSDYAYTFATIEEPDRAITQLKNLARGHALSRGCLHISMDDIPLVVSVVLSTASRERVMIFNHILKNNGLTDTIKIVDDLNTSKPTALRTMTEFAALGIVDKITLGDDHDVDGNGADGGYPSSEKTNALVQVRLKPEFDWFLTDEFQSLLGSSKKQDGYQGHIEDHRSETNQDIQTFLGANSINQHENPA